MIIRKRKEKNKETEEDDAFVRWEKDFELIPLSIHGLFFEYLELGEFSERGRDRCKEGGREGDRWKEGGREAWRRSEGGGRQVDVVREGGTLFNSSCTIH